MSVAGDIASKADDYTTGHVYTAGEVKEVLFSAASVVDYWTIDLPRDAEGKPINPKKNKKVYDIDATECNVISMNLTVEGWSLTVIGVNGVKWTDLASHFYVKRHDSYKTIASEIEDIAERLKNSLITSDSDERRLKDLAHRIRRLSGDVK